MLQQGHGDEGAATGKPAQRSAEPVRQGRLDGRLHEGGDGDET